MRSLVQSVARRLEGARAWSRTHSHPVRGFPQAKRAAATVREPPVEACLPVARGTSVSTFEHARLDFGRVFPAAARRVTGVLLARIFHDNDEQKDASG